jgi:hypothetical protein
MKALMIIIASLAMLIAPTLLVRTNHDQDDDDGDD